MIAAWAYLVGVGFSYSDGFGWMWGVNEVERDRSLCLMIVLVIGRQQSPKVYSLKLHPWFLLSYGFGILAELACVRYGYAVSSLMDTAYWLSEA
ncbi:hypothetical protein Tco_0573991 [Tanacetum coccineum]